MVRRAGHIAAICLAMGAFGCPDAAITAGDGGNGQCLTGYVSTPDGCTDIDECATAHGGCDALVSCTNTLGSRTCGACPGGYTGTGDTACACAEMCSTGGCIDIQSDESHCGQCGMACGTNGTCTSGGCEVGGVPCTNVGGVCKTAEAACASAGLACTGGYAMWPMPGTPGHPRSYVTGTDTVLDQVTGLEWQRAYDSTTYTFANAVTRCQDLVLDGKSDWRLPSRIELISIVDFAVGNPSIDTATFPGVPIAWFWSVSPMTMFTSQWDVSFGGGDSPHNGAVTDGGKVRCVR